VAVCGRAALDDETRTAQCRRAWSQQIHPARPLQQHAVGGVALSRLRDLDDLEQVPRFHATTRKIAHDTIRQVTARGSGHCRFTNVYPTGTCNYFKFGGISTSG